MDPIAPPCPLRAGRSGAPWRKATSLAVVGLLLATACAVHAETASAYARHSPIERFGQDDLSTSATLQKVDFGVALPVLERKGEAIRTVFPDGKPGWVRRTDVMVTPGTVALTSGPGYGMLERPKLRVWHDHNRFRALLSGGSADTSAPDLEEFFLKAPRGRLRLPVLYEDAVEILGKRSVPVSLVMVPVHGTLPKTFASVTGKVSAKFSISFLVDSSADAFAFSKEALSTLALDLERRLSRDGNTYELSLTRFSHTLPSRRVVRSGMTWDRLPVMMINTADRQSPFEEPILAGLAAAIPKRDDTRKTSILVVLTGAALQESHEAAALGGKVTLDTFAPDIPPDLKVIIAQVTPEPAPGLERFARRWAAIADTTVVPFDSGLKRDVAEIVTDILRNTEERVLEDPEIDQICAQSIADALPCFVPYRPTTDALMMEPLGRDKDKDWFAVTGWMVPDGTNLIRVETGAATPVE